MRRVLIISTTFFPDPQVSAIRMTQWCRYLPEHGWQPHVLCRYYGFEATPEELARHVHPEVMVEYLDRPAVGTQVVAPLMQRLARRVVNSWLLGGLFVPDVSIRFWHKRRKQILERVGAIKPDIIITTSPPHANHDIGLWLARETGIPWIADFRDPYLIDNRFKPTGLGRLRWRAHEHFWESIYRRAWLITHAIPLQARWARRRFPFARDRIRILMNGFPVELLDDLADDKSPSAPRSTVLVSGTIPEQEQLRLAKAVAMLVRRGKDLQLNLIGKRPSVEAPLRAILGERLVLVGYVPHRESIRAVAKADVLVNYLDRARSRTLLLSTKLFEYRASGKPVLAINSSRSDRLFLRGASKVQSLQHPTVCQIAGALENSLGNKDCGGTDLEEFRANYNWAAHARTLNGWLTQLIEFPPGVAPRKELGSEPLATVVISTRNQRENLHQPILSALHQSIPVELIVVDDGSTDGTAEMVRSEFPQVRLVQHKESSGYIMRRNEAARLASTPVIFSLDDDAEFSSPRVVQQTLAEFGNARTGAIAIPCVDVRQDHSLRQLNPDYSNPFVVDSFIGTAHAIRKDIFLFVGGYRSDLFHQAEERDFCLRMLNLGWVVQLGRADPIFHYEASHRDFSRMDFYGRRNDVLFAWHNVPSPWLAPHLVGTTFNGLLAAVRSGHWLRMLAGTISGYIELFRHARERRPVSARVYRLHRRLKKDGPRPLQAIESKLDSLPENFGIAPCVEIVP